MRIDSRMVTVAAGVDYMTDFTSWLAVQNGVNTPPIPTAGMAYCRSGRDLTHYVNIDQLFEAYFVCLYQFAQQRISRESRKSLRTHLRRRRRPPAQYGARSKRIAGAGRLRNVRRAGGLDAGVRTGDAGVERRLVSEVAGPPALAARGIWRARRGEAAGNTQLSDPFRSAERVEGAQSRAQQARNGVAADGVPRGIAESHVIRLGPRHGGGRVRDDAEGAV